MSSDPLFAVRDLVSVRSNPRFEVGMSGSTWWGRDREEKLWACEEEGRTVQWYQVRESGSKVRVGPISYSDYKRMF